MLSGLHSVLYWSLIPLVFFTMPTQKISFEESLELPEMTDSERQTLDELKESEDYYNSALTDAQRNPNL